MNKKLLRTSGWISILAAIVFVAGMFAGCATKAPAPTPTPAPAATEAPAATPEPTVAPTEDPLKDTIEISIALWSVGNMKNDGEDAVRDALYKKLNITVKPVNLTWDDYSQKIQVWAASAQLPDVFAIDAVATPNFKSWITQGVVHELPADLSPYPNLDKMMQGQDFQAYKYPLGDPNGKYFCIPRPNYRDANLWANDFGIILRKDWMQNVGVTKDPETMDEFIDLMKKFANNDPDQNGQNDTIGLTGYSTAWFSYLMIGYEPAVVGGVANWVKGPDGNWIPAFLTDGCKQGIVAMKKLYDEGGMDKDFAILKSEEGADKFASGKAGAYAHNVLPGTLKWMDDKWSKLNPDKKMEDCITFFKPFKMADGNAYRVIAPGCWSESYINATADDKKVDRILRLFDYLFSVEGFNLIHYGIEGEDYTVSGSEVTLIEQKKADGTALALSEKYPAMALYVLTEWSGTSQYTTPAIRQPLRKMSQDFLDWQLANCKPIPVDLRFGFVDYASKAKAVEKFDIDFAKAIMSDDAAATWDELNKTYMDNGYTTVIKDFNDALVAAGMK